MSRESFFPPEWDKVVTAFPMGEFAVALALASFLFVA